MKLPFNFQPKRTLLQEEALKKAKKTYNSDPEKYKDTMFCPYCGSPLVKSGEMRRFETLSEHVSNPNGTPDLKDEYVCSREGVFTPKYLYNGNEYKLTGCEFGVLHAWNGGHECGGSYVSTYWHKLCELRKESAVYERIIDSWFQDDNKHEHRKALNTFECEMQTSIYKVGLRRCYYLPSWLTLNIIQLTINLEYTANKFGEVTSTRATLGFLKKDGNTNDFCIKGQWPWSIWKYLHDRTYFEFKNAKKAKTEKVKLKHIAHAMNISGNDAWIYRLHQWYEYLIHPRYAKLLKKEGMYKKSTLNINFDE